jgi:hypothetical protein
MMGPTIKKEMKKKKQVRDVAWPFFLLDSSGQASGCFVHSRVRDHQREKGTAQQQQTFPSNKLAA